MIESALFFILGFLSAAFLAALVAPSIWRRATVLTRRRVETEVPLTLNEIQADKDSLRAEHAMAVRKLEMRLKALNEKHAGQKIELGANHEKLKRLSVLERELDALRQRQDERERELASTSSTLAAAEQSLERHKGELETLQLRHSELSSDADTLRIEIAVRETELGRLTGELDDMRHDRKKIDATQRELSAEVKSTQAALASERKRNAALEKKLERLLANLTDAREKLERRESDLARLRKGGATSPAREKTETKADQTAADDALREQMQELAAEVVAMTAEREGSQSPIRKALEQAETKSAKDAPESLADRIRSLKKPE
ncbi:hypothetical protein ATN84_11565 [Paramesorhizobium deserti]|uniref:Uncharacterized protein n=1 Tax=Paramesorhizobium deserti TaxID=1494590 RepID=A0A135HU17_9HYPH|nr:hypothetical protein [Paramesorhizobium deserti]KXF76673.1 hypothetical protein ATN84_11565 [Paramesorhizobium deserti]